MSSYSRVLNEVLLAFLSITHKRTNKYRYTLAEIRLPYTMISCLASHSAMKLCFNNSLGSIGLESWWSSVSFLFEASFVSLH